MRTFSISSLSNPLIKEAMKVRDKRAKFRNSAFLIEGMHLVEMALDSADTEIKRVFFTPEFSGKGEGRQLLARIEEERGSVAALVEVTDQIISHLADTETPQGIIAEISCRMVELEALSFKGSPFLVVCDGIQDPGNMGTIIRAADAAGADGIIILPGCCDLFMPKAIRATAGSLFSVPIAYSEADSLADYLDSRDIALAVADVRGDVFLYDMDLRGPFALAFGNEAQGAGAVMVNRAKKLIKIPVMGRAESLNVAMAASVCLYEAVRQRQFV